MRIVKPITITDSILISSTVPENDQQVYSNLVGYSLKDKVVYPNNHTVYEVINQETSTVTITNGSSTTIGWSNHGLVVGRMVRFSTSGTLPTGLSTTTNYYITFASVNSFVISATAGGTPVSTSTAGSGIHIAVALINNLDPTANTKYWLNIGSTNRWKMFDKTVQSQTVATTTFTTQVRFSDFVDTATFLNVSGTSIAVVVSTPSDGNIYSRTIDLATDESPIMDLWDYFFVGFKIKSDVIFDDIPPYANATYTITITSPVGQVAAIGAALFGLSKDISSAKKGVEQGARVGITDYSIKTRDAFGNYVITERAFSKRANWTVYVENTEIDDIQNILASCRAIPVLYIGSKKYASTLIYGFYKSFDVTIAYPEFSVLDIEIDGLT